MKLLFWVGAGLSQASGVPAPPVYDRADFLLHQDQCRRDFANWRQQVLACQPNRGHKILRQLQHDNPDVGIVTTNQDQLLQRAGCRVLELHGHGFCDNAIVRPGDDLDPAVLEQVFAWLEECDTLVVLGTSSRMQPGCDMPLRALGRARLIEINPEETPLSSRCDECWRGKAEELLERFLQ